MPVERIPASTIPFPARRRRARSKPTPAAPLAAEVQVIHSTPLTHGMPMGFPRRPARSLGVGRCAVCSSPLQGDGQLIWCIYCGLSFQPE